MIPISMVVSRYKAFSKTLVIPIAPVTIVIGPNGGGKSVITRLPLILASGIVGSSTSPIDLQAGGINHGSKYDDFPYKRSTQPFLLGAEASDGVDKYTFVTSMQYIIERYEIVVTSFQISKNEELLFRLSTDDASAVTPVYSLEVPGGEPKKISAQFIGLFPDALEEPPQLHIILKKAHDVFLKSFAKPSYLGPFRDEPSGFFRLPRQGLIDIGTRGEKSSEIIADDALRGNGVLANDIERWFNDNFGGTRVKLSTDPELPRLLVSDPIRGVETDLAQTGAGFAQILPIVLQTYARLRGKSESTMLCMEQPELHLHPAVHGSVADLMVDAVTKSQFPLSYICETHSEQLITRIRRRVAEDKIDHKSVKILSVGHRDEADGELEEMRILNVDKNGEVDAWPTGVFDEVLADVIKIRSALRKSK